MTILDDRFLVLDLLGKGGMGTVWRVRDQVLIRESALKLITSQIAFDPVIRARFRREARVMAQFQHPNAVTVYDARIGADAAFILMEYIRGKSLNHVPGAGSPRPVGWVARLLAQLGDVLQEARDHQIVHRDLKPSNLMIVPGRRPGSWPG
ncbi:serine/threonine-protein kinase [Tautonia sociabilis]|nr:serine/threonine-protein kinase [Tautonia sociabilis]